MDASMATGSLWSIILNRGSRANFERRIRCGYRDIETLAKRVERLSHTLFNDIVQFDVCEITEKGIMPRQILSERDIGTYLEGTDSSIENAKYHSQIFYFYQPFSWGRLDVSEDCMSKVLSYFDVFPDFMDILTVFGAKNGPIDEILGCYKFSIFRSLPQISPVLQVGDSTFSECCYLLKYVELHNRSEEQDRPWSIRQIGVYQKYDFNTKRAIYMLLQPSERLTEILAENLGNSNPDKAIRKDFCLDWTRLHLICLSVARDNWRDYINNLDSKVIIMASRLRFSRVDDKGILNKNHQQSAAFSNLQELEEINEELLRLRHVLRLNIQTLQTMNTHVDNVLDEITNFRSMSTGDTTTLKRVIRAAITDFEFYEKAVGSVYDRSARILSTLGNAIAIQDSHAIKTLAMIRNEGNAVTERLTWETIQETRTMKILAVLALVFLPATFVTGFLDMGYVSVSSISNGLMHVEVQDEFWLFIAISLSLVAVTVGAWLIWEYCQNKRKTDSGKERYMV